MLERFDQLKKDYGAQVLSTLFPGVSTELLGGGVGENEFSLELDPGALLNGSPQYVAPGRRFVHFTSLRGLHSILNERAIRMYNLKSTNDPREFEWVAKDFGYQPFRLDSFKSGTCLISMCLPNVLDGFGALNLWRFYGDNGWGCAIEIEFTPSEFNLTSDFMLGKVQYNKLDGSKFKEAHREFESKNNIRIDPESIIKVPACFHKSELFASENEVRFVRFSDYHNPAFLTRKELGNFYLDFNRRGEVVSYWKQPLWETQVLEPSLNITRIEIGFQHAPDGAKRIVEHLNQLFHALGMERKEILAPLIVQSPLKDTFRF